MAIPRLGVNIDHVATIRNARGGAHPDPIDAARMAIEHGADGITAHLREDRRHITDDDMKRLQTLCLEMQVPLNMEIAAVPEMAKIALELKPHAVCLVPERREERTTEGGLDAAGLHNQITPIVRELSENGSRVSLFIESLPHQISASHRCGAAVVEFHTGAYAHALDDGDQEKADQILEQLTEGARRAAEIGLEVHFGHGLTFDNVGRVAAIPEGMELNIGHFIIGEAIFSGLPNALAEMRRRIDMARTST